MAEKVIRGDMQGVRMAVECDLAWEFHRKVDCAIAPANTKSSRRFGRVGYGQIAVMDQALPTRVDQQRDNRSQPFKT